MTDEQFGRWSNSDFPWNSVSYMNSDSDASFCRNTPRTDVAKLYEEHIAALLFKGEGCNGLLVRSDN